MTAIEDPKDNRAQTPIPLKDPEILVKPNTATIVLGNPASFMYPSGLRYAWSELFHPSRLPSFQSSLCQKLGAIPLSGKGVRMARCG